MRRAFAAAGLAIACGAIEAPVFSNATTNECTDDTACAARFPAPSPKLCPATQPDCVKLKCVTGSCVLTPARVTFSLIVQVPTSNFRDPGMTLALSPKAIVNLQKKAPPTCTGGCLPIPIRGGAHGVLTVDDANGKLLWPGGLQGKDPSGFTSLPATITLRPLWSDGVSPQAPATWRGLELPEVEGTPTSDPGLAPLGPLGAAAIGYQVFLQSTPDVTDGLSSYEVTFHPAPPFDEAFPPLTVTQPFTAITPTANDLLRLAFTNFPYPNLQNPDFSTAQLPFKQVAGAPSTAGYRAYVIGLPEGERISNLVTLSGDPNETHQLFVARAPVANTKLVVDPPLGAVGRPSVVINSVGGSLVFAQPTFPKLPPPVTVTGTVSAFDVTGQLVPVAADLVFDSTTDGVFADDPNATQFNLNYRGLVGTNAVGAFSVVVPPGKYQVWITPHERINDPSAVPLSRTSKTVTVAVDKTKVTLAPLILSPRTHVKGRVLVGQSTPLVGAQIVARPSANRFKDDDQTLATRALAWPRESSTYTDAKGNYDLAVDVIPDLATHNLLDIEVRPLESTRLPRFVYIDQDITQQLVDGVVLPDLQLPTPMEVSLQLVDDFGNPIPRAVVTALMRPPSTDPMAARVVGRTLSDARGHFQLFLPSSLCESSSGACN